MDFSQKSDEILISYIVSYRLFKIDKENAQLAMKELMARKLYNPNIDIDSKIEEKINSINSLNNEKSKININLDDILSLIKKMKNLTFYLCKYLVFKISEIFQHLNSFQEFDIEDEDSKKYRIKIHSGYYGGGDHILQILYTDVDNIEVILFKKNDQNWYAIRYNNSDLNYIWKLMNKEWIQCSIKEQLRVALSFEEIFDAGLMLHPSTQKIDKNLILEVLDK